MNMRRITLLATIGATVLTSLLMIAPAAAQSAVIRIIVGTAPGGAIDPYARVIAEHMSRTLGQTIIIEHKPGASGSLAAANLVVGVAIGSLALISDALHSLIDFGATVVTWFAVRAADRPPDAEHQYGHGKIESVAALAVTALLFLLAGGVGV